MTQPILGYAELDLFEELGSEWPWVDSADYDAPDSAGSALCGPLEYRITDSDGVDTDIVRLNDDMTKLIYEPTFAHGPGGRTIQLKLIARLSWYPQIDYGQDSFRVTLTDCMAEIDPSRVVAQLEDQEVVWGDSPVSYDVYSILADYEQSPACQYTFKH